jgi:hypothetical protein
MNYLYVTEITLISTRFNEHLNLFRDQETGDSNPLAPICWVNRTARVSARAFFMLGDFCRRYRSSQLMPLSGAPDNTLRVDTPVDTGI